MPDNLNIQDSEPIVWSSRNNGSNTSDEREVEFIWYAKDTASLPSMHFSAIVKCENEADTQSIFVALQGMVEYKSSFNMTGNGHAIGVIGETKLQSTGTVAFLVPMEARFDIEAAGTATLVSNILITTGNNSGFVTRHHCIYIPDFSGVSGFSNLGTSERFSFYSTTPGYAILNTGDIQTGGKFIATGVTSGQVQNMFQLQQHNSINAGSAFQFVLNDGSKSEVGKFLHTVTSGSQANFSFKTLRGGTVQDALDISGAALASADTVLVIMANDGAVTSMRRVSMGAADSQSAGFRALRVPN